MRWKNVPIPEAHITGLVLGVILQFLIPLKIFQSTILWHGFGGVLIISGIFLCAWAVFEAGQHNIEKPDMLLISGPYALSRNLMYVGWTLIVVGIAFAANWAWILFLAPVVILYIHFVDILKEEKQLTEKFGETYRAYKKQVRRYF